VKPIAVKKLKAPRAVILVLSKAQENHLRRLLGYVRCEIGQDPAEVVDTVRLIASKCGPISEEGKQRLVEHYQHSARIPKYVRAAVKSLETLVTA
jgi:hypothetical protein